MAHEVAEEEHGALQHPDQQQVLALVVARDLLAELAHAVLQLVGLDEDLADLGFRASGGSRCVPVGVRSKRSTPLLDDRARAVADVERAVEARAQVVEAARPPAARGARARPRRARRTTSRRAPAAARAGARPRSGRGRRAPSSRPRRAPRPRRAAARRCAGCCASAARVDSRSAGTRPSRTRARAKTASSLAGVVDPAQAARAHQAAVSSRVTSEQRAHEPARRAAPCPSSARRPGEDASR